MKGVVILNCSLQAFVVLKGIDLPKSLSRTGNLKNYLCEVERASAKERELLPPLQRHYLPAYAAVAFSGGSFWV